MSGNMHPKTGPLILLIFHLVWNFLFEGCPHTSLIAKWYREKERETNISELAVQVGLIQFPFMKCSYGHHIYSAKRQEHKTRFLPVCLLGPRVSYDQVTGTAFCVQGCSNIPKQSCSCSMLQYTGKGIQKVCSKEGKGKISWEPVVHKTPLTSKQSQVDWWENGQWGQKLNWTVSLSDQTSYHWDRHLRYNSKVSFPAKATLSTSERTFLLFPLPQTVILLQFYFHFAWNSFNYMSSFSSQPMLSF